MARTVIDIDEEIFARAQQLTGLRNKEDLVKLRPDKDRGANGDREDNRSEG